MWKRKKGKKEKEENRKERVGAYMRVLMKNERAEIRSRSKKLLSSRLLAGTRTQIQDEVVLRSKPNFAKVAGALSCRIPFLPGEYRDRCFRVVEHPRCISLPLELNFPPLFTS